MQRQAVAGGVLVSECDQMSECDQVWVSVTRMSECDQV